MRKNTVRAGLVGSGFAANLHIEGIHRVYGTNVEVVGVHARDQAKATAFADAHGGEAFAELDALLEKIDVLHIVAPSSLHEAFAVRALERDVHAIVEKPLTGYFGDGGDGFDARDAAMSDAKTGALDSNRRMLAAEAISKGSNLYAKNWVYAPAIQKEREVIEKTEAQTLWLHGEEAHSGSHAEAYGHWRLNGGGAMIGKRVHPLSAALYLKKVEGRARLGKPIRPKTVTARTHSLTRLDGFQDKGHLRTVYHNVKDFAMIHVTFEDGTIATVFASEIVMGGIHNWLEVCANNHRTNCDLNPNDMMQTYNPVDAQFDDIYVVEKTGTKQGWAKTAPDEDSTHGFPQEVEAFYRTVAYGDPVESDSQLAADTISTVYSRYLSAEQEGAQVTVELL